MTPRLAAAVAALASLTIASASFAAAPPATPPVSAAPLALTLAQAENIALASSPLLAVARGQLEQAQAGIASARSGELPNLSGSASQTRSGSTTPAGTFGLGSPAFTTQATSRQESATLRQLIVDGGRVHDEVQSARFSTDASQLNLDRQVETVQFDVAQAYYAALQARHILATAVDSLNLAQVQEKLVNAQFKAGVASKADLLTAQLPVAQAQLAVAQASNGEQTQVATLLNTMGLSSQTPVTVADEGETQTMLPPLEVVLDSAMTKRPDLLAAQAQFNGAVASVRAARLGLFPTLNASASESRSSTAIDQEPNTGAYAPAHAIGFTLSIPIFDGGLTRALTASAQAGQDQAAANLKSAQLLVSLNVQQAYLGVQTAQAGLTAAQAEYADARTVLDVTDAQYKAGVTTLPLLLNAQVGLTKAESDQVNALYTYKTAWQQLLLAEGTIGGP